jgi:hypothetical protein
MNSELTELSLRCDFLIRRRDKIIEALSGGVTSLSLALEDPKWRRREVGEINEHLMVIDHLIELLKGAK